jgi:hypothetical protein
MVSRLGVMLVENLTPALRQQLVSTLLRLPGIEDASVRAQLLLDLPLDLRTLLPRHAAAKIDVNTMVTYAVGWDIAALVQLLDNAIRLAPGSQAGQELQRLRTQLGGTPHRPRSDLTFDLGEPFRRYFATVMARPFYPLPDQVAVLNQAKVGLLAGAGSPIVVLSGAGGIGKTTIAGELVRQSQSIGFLKALGDSAKLQVYEDARLQSVDEPASLEWSDLLNTVLLQLGSPSIAARSLPDREHWVRRQLQLEKYLVLVDNLETVHNAQDLARRLRTLLLGGNSRALLTYRYRDLGELQGVYHVAVQGLREADSMLFVENELAARGFPSVLKWLAEKGDTEQQLQETISLTRGWPLALQLVIGLRTALPLASVYALLKGVTVDRRVEALYEFLFRQELNLLSDPARDLLTRAFARQSGYYVSELINLMAQPAGDVLPLLGELARVSLLYAHRHNRPRMEPEDYFYVHPLLHHLLRKVIS